MFANRVRIEVVTARGERSLARIHWIDNFAMRNFTNDAVFDDTLPVGDGVLEVGYGVPLDRLQAAMENWFRRKGYLAAHEWLEVQPQQASAVDAMPEQPEGRSTRCSATSDECVTPQKSDASSFTHRGQH